MQNELTSILTNQAVLLTNVEHIKQLLEKQNGRVAKLEDRAIKIEERITATEKDDIKQKAWFSGVAAGIGAIAAVGIDKVVKLFEGLGG